MLKFRKFKFKLYSSYFIQAPHKFRNNQNSNLEMSLKTLKIKTQNKELVIGYFNKDGKTIIMDFDDYISLIKQPLE